MVHGKVAADIVLRRRARARVRIGERRMPAVVFHDDLRRILLQDEARVGRIRTAVEVLYMRFLIVHAVVIDAGKRHVLHLQAVGLGEGAMLPLRTVLQPQVEITRLLCAAVVNNAGPLGVVVRQRKVDLAVLIKIRHAAVIVLFHHDKVAVDIDILVLVHIDIDRAAVVRERIIGLVVALGRIDADIPIVQVDYGEVFVRNAGIGIIGIRRHGGAFDREIHVAVHGKDAAVSRGKADARRLPARARIVRRVAGGTAAGTVAAVNVPGGNTPRIGGIGIAHGEIAVDRHRCFDAFARAGLIDIDPVGEVPRAVVRLDAHVAVDRQRGSFEHMYARRVTVALARNGRVKGQILADQRHLRIFVQLETKGILLLVQTECRVPGKVILHLAEPFRDRRGAAQPGRVIHAARQPLGIFRRQRRRLARSRQKPDHDCPHELFLPPGTTSGTS